MKQHPLLTLTVNTYGSAVTKVTLFTDVEVVLVGNTVNQQIIFS
jgi:hypothetical protein